MIKPNILKTQHRKEKNSSINLQDFKTAIDLIAQIATKKTNHNPSSPAKKEFNNAH